MSELRDLRLDRLEADVGEINRTLKDLVRLLHRIDAQMPHLATKAELAMLDSKLSTMLADKPGRGYLWGVMGTLLAGQAVILAAAGLVIALLLPRLLPPSAAAPSHAGAAFGGIVLAAAQSPPPYSCRLFYDEEKKCAFGSCDKRVLERLRNECLRDGGRP